MGLQSPQKETEGLYTPKGRAGGGGRRERQEAPDSAPLPTFHQSQARLQLASPEITSASSPPRTLHFKLRIQSRKLISPCSDQISVTCGGPGKL